MASRGKWIPAPHLLALNNELINIEAGRTDRLIIEIPPRHGKSVLTSEHFPAHYLGTFPDRSVILTSYEAQFAASWGKKARDLLTEWGPELFGVRVRQDSRARNWWELVGTKGRMMTAGAGGPITGKGGNLFIIDDPFKNWVEASSKARQDMIESWYRSTVITRLEAPDAVVIAMQRWHVRDLAGVLLDSESDGGDRWKVIRLAAVAEADDPLGRAPGAPLWPQVFPLSRLERIRKNSTPYFWSAQYQQAPYPIGGDLIRTDWLEQIDIDELPRYALDDADADRRGQLVPLKWARFWDLATSTKQTADYLASCLMGRYDPPPDLDDAGQPLWRQGDRDQAIYYILDITNERLAWPDGEQRIRTIAAREPNVKTCIEANGFQLAAVQQLQRKMPNRRLGSVRADKDKVSRVGLWTPAAANGRMKIVRGANVAAVLAQAAAFPNGDHDDMIDAISGAFKELHGRASFAPV